MPQRSAVNEIIGWLGVIAILGSYAASIWGLIQPTSILYLLLNLCGSCAIIIEAAKKNDAQPVVLNAIWAIIAFMGLLRFFLQ